VSSKAGYACKIAIALKTRLTIDGWQPRAESC
jgi:hypothetical protein